MRGLTGAALWGALGLGFLAACSGVPAGLPGTATCEVGLTERTYPCAEICSEATRARSSEERNQIRACARSQCNAECD